MTEEKAIVDVVFRRWTKARYQNGEVIALFPYEIESWRGECLSYMHIGQHGPASYEIVNDTVPADPSEPDVAALVRELQSIGYKLRLIKRRNYRKWHRAVEEFMQEYPNV